MERRMRNTALRIGRCGAAAALTVLCAPPALAWNAHGHRVITCLALDGLPQGMPAWLREARVAAMIAEQSGEPDRWRGTRESALAHENSPDHYLDVERLADFGLTLGTMPRLRHEYIEALALARRDH